MDHRWERVVDGCGVRGRIGVLGEVHLDGRVGLVNRRDCWGSQRSQWKDSAQSCDRVAVLVRDPGIVELIEDEAPREDEEAIGVQRGLCVR